MYNYICIFLEKTFVSNAYGFIRKYNISISNIIIYPMKYHIKGYFQFGR